MRGYQYVYEWCSAQCGYLGQPPHYCGRCGHRLDVHPMVCDCPQCRQQCDHCGDEDQADQAARASEEGEA